MSRDKQIIKTTDWLTRGMTEEEIAKKKEEAIKEAEAELRNKQVEEMAKDLQETHDYDGCEAWHCGGCEYEKYGKNYFCSSIKQAEKMTAKGYSKASEVAEEIFAEIEKIRAKEIHRCETLRENEKDLSERKYWEGGEHSLRQLSYWIAELKKKYTGKGINVPTIEAVEGKKKIIPHWEYEESEDTE